MLASYWFLIIPAQTPFTIAVACGNVINSVHRVERVRHRVLKNSSIRLNHFNHWFRRKREENFTPVFYLIFCKSNK